LKKTKIENTKKLQKVIRFTYYTSGAITDNKKSYNSYLIYVLLRCASGYVVECWTCNQEVAGLDLGQGLLSLPSLAGR